MIDAYCDALLGIFDGNSLSGLSSTQSAIAQGRLQNESRKREAIGWQQRALQCRRRWNLRDRRVLQEGETIAEEMNFLLSALLENFVGVATD